MRRLKVSLGSLALVSLVAVLAAGCGGSSKKAATTTTTPSTTTTSANAKIAAEVPAAIKSKGTLTVATDATYPPNEFVASNGTTVTGWDPELAQALASVLGLKVKLVNATFATIIPGIQSGKYGLSMSSFTDTKERQKVVDFVTYFTAGTSFYVKTSGGPTINSLADLCGHSVGVETGTTQADDAKAQSAKCKSAKGLLSHFSKNWPHSAAPVGYDPAGL